MDNDIDEDEDVERDGCCVLPTTEFHFVAVARNCVSRRNDRDDICDALMLVFFGSECVRLSAECVINDVKQATNGKSVSQA